MSDLPTGWVETTISEVVEPKVEQRTPLEDEHFYYIDISSIDRTSKKIVDPQKLSGKDAPSRARQVVASGDVLVSMTRPNLNAVAMVSDDLDKQIASTGFDVLRAKGVDSRWLYYLVRTNDFVTAMSNLVQGALYPAVRPRDIRNFEIPLAPLNEQKRIAEKLDSLLTRVDSCERHLERVPQILKRFRQSVLAAATSGRLTEDWREENAVIGNWRLVNLSEVATSRLGKMLDVAKNRGELHPYLRNINVRWFAFDLSDIQELRISEEEAKTLGVRKGDVLICEGGEPGRCAVWNGEDDVYLFQKALHRVRVGEKLLPEWLCYCLKSSADSGKLAEYFTGTTIKHFTGISLSRFEFELPSLEEQAEIVRRVESLFAYAERLEARYLSASERVARLTPSLLAKGFRGELVEQDSNDESAEKLLERIRASIVNAPKEAKKTQRRTNMKSVKSKQDGKRISLIQALQDAGKELSSEQLFQAAGFPSDAEAALVEEFFVEIRDALQNKHIKRRREGNSDWFSLLK